VRAEDLAPKLDLMDDTNHAFIEFSSAQNADLNARGLDHLLCGRGQ